MAAPQLTAEDLDKSADAAVERAFTRLKVDLAKIPSTEELDKLHGAVRDFKGTAIDKARNELTPAMEEKFRAILGEQGYPEFKKFEEEIRGLLKQADQKGTPLATRAVMSLGDDVKRQAYASMGAKALRAWCAAETGSNANLPDLVRAQLAFTENKGGAAIPDHVDSEWSYIMLDHSVARQILPPTRQLPLPDDSNTVIWPTITVRPTSIKGTENNNSGSTDATLATKANSSAVAELLKGWTSFSKAIPPRQLAIMMTIIGNMLAEDIGYEEDVWFFTGGTSANAGVMDGATGIGAGNVVFEGATSIDALNDINSHIFFGKMKGRIQPNHIGRGVYVFGPEVWTVIESLTDSQNRPLYGTGPMGSTPAQFSAPVSVPTELRFMNRPVYLSSALPSVAAATSGTRWGIYFDPTAAAIASRPGENTIDDHVEAKELNRVIIQWELFAHRLLQPTCAVAAVLA